MTLSQEKLSRLQAQKQRVETQIQRIVYRKRKQERQQDTRRKIVVGAMVLKAAARNAKFAAQLRRLLEQQVTAERDRLLLGLPLHKEVSSATNDSASLPLQAA